jgi:hypothetical protein
VSLRPGLRVFPDHGGDGLWPRPHAPRVPREGLDPELRARLEDWNRRWDGIFGLATGPDDLAARRRALAAEGEELARALKRRHPEIEVFYLDDARLAARLEAERRGETPPEAPIEWEITTEMAEAER